MPALRRPQRHRWARGARAPHGGSSACTHTHADPRVHARMHTCECTHARTHTHAHVHTHLHARTDAHTHAHTQNTHTETHVPPVAHMHADTHTCTQTRIHAPAHTHTNVRTHARLMPGEITNCNQLKLSALFFSSVIHAHIPSRVHTWSHTHKRARTHTHRRTHTECPVMDLGDTHKDACQEHHLVRGTFWCSVPLEVNTFLFDLPVLQNAH